MFMLARDLGCTVAELKHRMTGVEFAYWQAFYGIEGQLKAQAQEES
jgi:hypothetical protein